MATPPPVIETLVELFDRNIETYKSPAYDEAKLRVEFVNKFWKALGWDIDNDQGHALPYQDVIHEDSLKMGGSTKAPDYSFRVGGQRKFFLETKKPAVNIKDDPDPAYQLRRYAWTAKLPLSILTDFESLAVYDGRVRPRPRDKASAARIDLIEYTDYLSRWEEIASRFSKEAIQKGLFDKYAGETKGKRGTAEVDAEFLKELEGWRDVLARNLALRNPALTRRELNYAVQMTIDRIVFLRLCEDRGIERFAQLQALTAGPGIYPRLAGVFRAADQKYNSGLFHFEKERDRPGEPDALTPSLQIDDKVLKDILASLYMPACPYEFSVLPPEILGSAYERFLGKVITLTKGHQARIEEKPEVRKAGGVYYTPQYIVDYIVRNTVGGMIEGKPPEEISSLKILDPACGSGSFLLGAYRYLLDYHLDWYTTRMKADGEVPVGAGLKPAPTG
ncbi:MAG: N-6 DNA methylase, partial [Candidatus Tectomicrobia bacterium]|nr:N-6 DNA methylase [Candidatus Tectomicrobia bacterium]